MCELILVEGPDWHEIRDSEEMPSPVLTPNETVVLDIPVFVTWLVYVGVVYFDELAGAHHNAFLPAFGCHASQRGHSEGDNNCTRDPYYRPHLSVTLLQYSQVLTVLSVEMPLVGF